jgi:hypothetical protein
VVGDYDHGVGIVRKGPNPALINIPQSMDAMTYQQFVDHRVEWMRPISFEDVKNLAVTVTPTGGTGVTSVLSCRLHAVAAYHREHGRLPAVVDSRDQFWLYRDVPGQNVAARLFAEVVQIDVARTDYDHGWCFGWCDKMQLESLARMAQAVCFPSLEVITLAQRFTDFVENRTAVVYRGNDKVKDSPLVDYETMIVMAQDTGSKRFIVQTDELDFYEYFKRHFPDTVRFENFTMIRRDPNVYILPALGLRAQFAVDFFAAIIALARAPQLLIVTGNIGMWCALFRGHLDGLWQADGAEKTWRLLGQREEQA